MRRHMRGVFCFILESCSDEPLFEVFSSFSDYMHPIVSRKRKKPAFETMQT